MKSLVISNRIVKPKINLGRLQTIENRLIEIGSAEFQELCDSYLNKDRKRLFAFWSGRFYGGKQKTSKGTPDLFFELSNGNFIEKRSRQSL